MCRDGIIKNDTADTVLSGEHAGNQEHDKDG